VSGVLDALTCLVVGCVLFPLGAWGRGHANSLVVDTVQGTEREHRVSVLRRGALTCQVVAALFAAVAFVLLATR